MEGANGRRCTVGLFVRSYQWDTGGLATSIAYQLSECVRCHPPLQIDKRQGRAWLLVWRAFCVSELADHPTHRYPEKLSFSVDLPCGFTLFEEERKRQREGGTRVEKLAPLNIQPFSLYRLLLSVSSRCVGR